MLEFLPRYVMIGLIAFTAIAWIVVVVRAWAPRAQARGGAWYLEAMMFLCAPVLTSLVFFYPSEGPLTGPLPYAARAVTIVCVGLAVWSLIQSASQPRRGVGAIAGAIALYYFAMILSGLVGAVPGIPEPYFTTPIIVLAFVVNGRYTSQWLMRTARFNLRAILALSILVLVVMPLSAFNTQESRTFLGISRFEGIVGHPNGLAMVAVVALLIEITSTRSRFWTVVAVVALLFAQSNTVWIALAFALAFSTLRLAKAVRVLAAGVAVALASSILIWPERAAQIESRMTGGNFSFNGRSEIWAAAMEGFRLHPVFGYGPSLLGDDFRAIYLPNFDAAAQAHNQFIQSLAESGIVGMLALLCLGFVLFSRAVHLRHLGYATPLVLLLVMLARAMSETPLRPVGPGISTFLLIVVVAAIATQWSERPSKLPTGHSLESEAGDRPQSLPVPSTRVA